MNSTNNKNNLFIQVDETTKRLMDQVQDDIQDSLESNVVDLKPLIQLLEQLKCSEHQLEQKLASLDKRITDLDSCNISRLEKGIAKVINEVSSKSQDTQNYISNDIMNILVNIDSHNNDLLRNLTVIINKRFDEVKMLLNEENNKVGSMNEQIVMIQKTLDYVQMRVTPFWKRHKNNISR